MIARRVRRFPRSRLRLQRTEAGQLVHPRPHRAGRSRSRVRESLQPVHLGSFRAHVRSRRRSIPRSPAAKSTASSGPPRRGPFRPTSAIAFHPKFEYVAVEVGGDVYIVAAELLNVTAEKLRLGRPQDARRVSRRETRRRRLPPSLSRSRFARHPGRSRHARTRHRRGPHRARPRPGRLRGRPSSTASPSTARSMPPAVSITPKAPPGRLPEELIGKTVWEAQPDRHRNPESARRAAGDAKRSQHSYPHCWRCHNADHLPRHRTVVHRHGAQRSARSARSKPSSR